MFELENNTKNSYYSWWLRLELLNIRYKIKAHKSEKEKDKSIVIKKRKEFTIMTMLVQVMAWWKSDTKPFLIPGSKFSKIYKVNL